MGCRGSLVQIQSSRPQSSIGYKHFAYNLFFVFLACNLPRAFLYRTISQPITGVSSFSLPLWSALLGYRHCLILQFRPLSLSQGKVIILFKGTLSFNKLTVSQPNHRHYQDNFHKNIHIHPALSCSLRHEMDSL